MKIFSHILLTVVASLALGSCTWLERDALPPPSDSAVSPNSRPTEVTAPPAPTVSPTNTPSAPATATINAAPTDDLLALISTEVMFEALTDLTNIEAYSGWRNSAAQGEREAILYLKNKLTTLDYLNDLGLEIESQQFNVFLATELWETRLRLTLNGKEIEVPADGLRGPRDRISQALRFDSDGVLNDAAPDPVEIKGSVLVVRSADQIKELSPSVVADKIIFVDYATIDRTLLGVPAAIAVASELMSKRPAGIVLVTRFSNKANQSHGTFIGDVSALNWVATRANPVTLYVRLEDLVVAGIETWEDLEKIEAARLTWDADVFSPGSSQNLIARIPGVDSSQAVLLTAHIDSANSPGALDDAAGSVVLLEVARILNGARLQPKTDIYLIWFGSQALGFYGSYNFVAHHQALLDRTLAMLQIDSMAHPLDNIKADLNLVTWSYGRLGNDTLTWPNYLAEVMGSLGVETKPANLYELESDNTAFTAFDVPNANLIYLNRPAMEAVGGFHYAAHSHDPYDTTDLVMKQAHILEQMTKVALTAVLNVAERKPYLRVTPQPNRRVLFIGTHTEAIHMTPAAFTDLGMAMAMEGFDVDQIPYGQPATPTDLVDADLVIVLPAVDYPSPQGDVKQYDTVWSEGEVDALEAYVEQGGLLVLTNSAHRLKYGNWTQDPNEDWGDMNALANRFGVTYYSRAILGKTAQVQVGTPFTGGLSMLTMAEDNGVAFALNHDYPFGKQILAYVDDTPVAVLLDYGDAGGQVLVLADVGILNADWNQPPANLLFWQQLARYRGGEGLEVGK